MVWKVGGLESEIDTSYSGNGVHITTSDSSSPEMDTMSQRLSGPPVVAQTRPKGGCQTAMPPAGHGMAQPKYSDCSRTDPLLSGSGRLSPAGHDTSAEKPLAKMNIGNTPDNLQIEMSGMSLKMADGSPPAEVAILIDPDILQKELSVMTVTSKRWMERFVMNPQVLCLDGLTSDYDPEDRCSNVDGDEGVFQDPILEVVSVRPEVAEKWMDQFVVDLVENPSVFRKSVVVRTFGPAVSEENSPVVFTGGGGGGWLQMHTPRWS